MGCEYPEHHGGGGPVGGWIVALIAGLLIVAEWRVLAVVVGVCVVLAVAGIGVLAMYRSASSEPYDGGWAEPESARTELQARVVQLERELAERPAIEAPQQHLHLHGIDAAQVAAIIRQQQDAARPAIEESR
jgi:hypothetical protein